MGYNYSFKDVLDRAERVTWRVEDLIGGDKTLDFTRPFMPESLARVRRSRLSLGPRKDRSQPDPRTLLFAHLRLVEEFILPFVLDQARSILTGEDYRVRAYLEFAGEEAKHIHLFHRFTDAFDQRLRHDVRRHRAGARPSPSTSYRIIRCRWRSSFCISSG